MDQIANIHWIIEKARDFQKSIYFCFIDYAKALTVWITTNCGKFLKRWEYQDWFQIGKGVHQGCISSPCLFNFYAEYIMQNAGLDESQAGSKIAGRNINNLRYADDTTLMVESEEKLKSLLMRVKEESEKSWLKIQHSKN